MRGVPIKEEAHKYLYRSTWAAPLHHYVRYHFYLDGRNGAQGEVYRTGRNDKTWYARHYNYPGEGDIGSGRTRDEAVDKLLSLIGEG